ncbi:N4-gp56 family major capsid protein [Fusobacterium necrophorum]|uniref:N4-gp56 family major capsid protein n=1 Tax=Fusobacterium necrophorum TaxID=859 RepID=UPI00254A34C7|nr:N4-gp56 family major capsid protein [Fusobacterium necrophorum]MDK4472301.1 N4-gp56 family major capsid protein [Fusobacterium necrophorum]MDK4478811.1 N4-gp56 family major capsid protein [Fusobacterium necrophorum]MDK4517990.1 N4-gp56 family major capsid protein [Fusobacterium necrophorum]
MANETKKQHVIIPEVMEEMVREKLPHKLRFSVFCDIDDTLVGTPGDTITLPKWGLIGEAQDVEELGAIPYQEMSSSKTTATIKKVGKGITISDEAMLSGLGKPIDEATEQLAIAVARKIDADALTALKGAKLKFGKGATELGYELLCDALTKFEEDIDSPKVLFVTPDQYSMLRKNKDFLGLKDLAGTPILFSGVVGAIAGCQVVVTANKAILDAGTKVDNLVVMPGALRLVKKRDAKIETGRDMDHKATKINIDQHYVIAIKDDTKILKISTLKPTITDR